MKSSLGISDFLEEISSLPILLFSSISFHWSLRKAFLSLFAILWNSAFKWVYISFSPLPFTSLLFTAICKASSDNHFVFFLGMVLLTTSYTVLQASIHSSSGTLSDLIPWICHSHCMIISLVLFRSYLNSLVVFPTFFNFAIRSSWSEPQSAPGFVFADCSQLLHLWLQEKSNQIWFQYWPSGDVHV